jgi:hypothetical protein
MDQDIDIARKEKLAGWLWKNGAVKDGKAHNSRSKRVLSAVFGTGPHLFRKRWCTLIGTTIQYAAVPQGKALGYINLSDLDSLTDPKWEEIKITKQKVPGVV